MAEHWLLAAALGFLAGYLSGQFGIGGGIITTPGIRMLLGYPELIAVGTPLPVIIPTALAGAVSYVRAGMADTRAGLAIGVFGGAFTVLGAWLTTLVGGSFVLLVTAALIAYMAVDMIVHVIKPGESVSPTVHDERRRSWPWLGMLGAVTGLYSGFLGLGGGFIVVPLLVRLFGFPAKRATGTSLIAVSILAVPGTVTHYALGNIEPTLAFALAVGTIPGALLGAQVTMRSSERTLRIGFAALLIVVGVVLALSELGVLG